MKQLRLNREQSSRMMEPALSFDQPSVDVESNTAAIAEQLWTILNNHNAGRFTAAQEGWERIRLPRETQIWRDIALGALALRSGNLAKANLHLGAARMAQPHHAVAAYYTGLLRLEQAYRPTNDPENSGDRLFRLASTPPFTRAPSKHAYEVMAMSEFRTAIARAHEVKLDAPLLMTNDAFEPLVIPSVGHLLAALKCESYTFHAHSLLFDLELQHGMLHEAEDHLDRAVASGVEIPLWYEELTRAYVDMNQEADALRIAKKYVSNTFGDSVLLDLVR